MIHLLYFCYLKAGSINKNRQNKCSLPAVIKQIIALAEASLSRVLRQNSAR